MILNLNNLQVHIEINKVDYNITNMVTNLTMQGAINSVSKSVTFNVSRGVYTQNFPNLTIPGFCKVWIKEVNDDGSLKLGMFSGVAVKIDENDKQYTINAYDIGFYLKGNEVSHTFKGVTAEAATKTILDEFKFPYSTIAATGVTVNQVIHKKSAYDSIMSLYTEAINSKNLKKKYFVEINYKNEINVKQVGYYQCKTIISPHKSGVKCCGNLLEVSYSEDGSNMVNVVEILDEKYQHLENKTNELDKETYGIIRKQIVKQNETNKDGTPSKTAATQNITSQVNQTLHGIDRTLTVTILGDFECRYGRTVLLDIPFLNSSYLKDKKWHLEQDVNKPLVGYIKSDTQTFDLGNKKYTTKLEITLEPFFDAHDEGEVDYGEVGTDGVGYYSGGQVLECSSDADMISKYKNYIIAVSRKIGTYPSVIAAQVYCESAKPFKTLEKVGHNPFGIKYSSSYARRFGATSGSYGTTEYYGNGATHIRDSFCHFTCYEDAIVANATIFWGSPYKSAQNVLKNFSSSRDEYINAMGRVYATSPVYANSIKNMIRSKGLDEFDRLAYPNGRHHVVINSELFGTYDYPSDTYSHYTVNYNSTNKGNAGIGVSLPQPTTNYGSGYDDPKIAKLIELAKSRLGIKYVWGGTDWDNGMDCSGFTMQCYSRIGYNITRTTYTQVKQGSYVNPNDMSSWKPGDLVFPHSGHVQLYIGGGQVIHEPHTGDVCRYANAKSGAYAVRRIIS